jgi:hypothetical protein
LAELMSEIAVAVQAGDEGAAPPPALRPYEQAVLTALQAAGEPLSVRGVFDASGVPSAATTATALTTLHGQDLVMRYREGRVWLYTCAVASQ